MRRADARRSASMMISSSIKWSLAGYDVDCMDENVRAAHVFLDLDKDLHVGEAPRDSLGQRRAEVTADGFGKRGIGIAGDELDSPVVARRSHFSCAPGSGVRRPDTSRLPGFVAPSKCSAIPLSRSVYSP